MTSKQNNKNKSRPRLDLSRHVPPGIDWRGEANRFGIWMAFSGFFAYIAFIVQYLSELGDLGEWVNGKRVLFPGAVMPDFYLTMDWVLSMYLVIALCMIYVAVGYYRSHYQGSMSIYLMRRLPDPWERHRRCLTLPLLGALLCGAAALLTILLCYAYYMIATPDACLTPGQWQKYWRFVL